MSAETVTTCHAHELVYTHNLSHSGRRRWHLTQPRRQHTDLKMSWSSDTIAQFLALLKRSHGVLAICHIAAASVFIFVAARNSYTPRVPVLLRYNIWVGGEEGCGEGGSCRIATYYHTYATELELVYAVPFFSYVSGSHHLVAYLSLARSGDMSWCWDGYTTGRSYLRWADYAVSSTLMVIVNAAMWTSPCLLSTILMWLVVQPLVIACGAASDVLWFEKSRWMAWGVYLAALLTYPAAWATVWEPYAYSIRTENKTGDFPPGPYATFDPPLVVTLILCWITASFAAFPLIHFFKLRDASGEIAVYESECYYNVASFAAKFPLLALYFTGLVMRAQNDITPFDKPGDRRSSTTATTQTGPTTTSTAELEDRDLTIAVFSGSLALAVIGGIWTLRALERIKVNSLRQAPWYQRLWACRCFSGCFSNKHSSREKPDTEERLVPAAALPSPG